MDVYRVIKSKSDLYRWDVVELERHKSEKKRVKIFVRDVHEVYSLIYLNIYILFVGCVCYVHEGPYIEASVPKLLNQPIKM